MVHALKVVFYVKPELFGPKGINMRRILAIIVIISSLNTLAQSPVQAASGNNPAVETQQSSTLFSTVEKQDFLAIIKAEIPQSAIDLIEKLKDVEWFPLRVNRVLLRGLGKGSTFYLGVPGGDKGPYVARRFNRISGYAGYYGVYAKPRGDDYFSFSFSDEAVEGSLRVGSKIWTFHSFDRIFCIVTVETLDGGID